MKNIKVLIVEDDPIMSFLHREMVKKHELSLDPLNFMNGKEALDFILSDTSLNFYLILLDLNMPVMNGWEFLNELASREVSFRISVAIVTSSVDRTDREKANRYELVDFYLSKPLLDFSPVRKAFSQLQEKRDEMLKSNCE